MKQSSFCAPLLVGVLLFFVSNVAPECYQAVPFSKVETDFVKSEIEGQEARFEDQTFWDDMSAAIQEKVDAGESGYFVARLPHELKAYVEDILAGNEDVYIED